MKTSLDHLPAAKVRELERVKQTLFEEFEAAMAGATADWKKRGRILKIILFGSFARGGWVDDRASGYKSDYDLLVVVNDARLTDFEFWDAAEDRLLFNSNIRHEVQLIIEPLQRVNDELAKGQYFFSDIKKDGIALYELKGHKLADAKVLTAEEYGTVSRKYLERELPRSRAILERAGMAPSREDALTRNLDVFLLHQAAESAYQVLLQTLTHYAPATHNIKTLRGLAEDLDQRLVEVWPRYHRADKRKFELLKRAYIEARYSEHYAITTEELEWLETRLQLLQETVEQICQERLNAT